MSTFERDEYKWRETYFVLFDSTHRPSLAKVESLLNDLSSRFQLTNPRANDDGLFESITIMSPDDYAALDMSYESGEEVTEQVVTLQEELAGSLADDEERGKLEQLVTFDARLDLLHFEQTSSDTGEDELDEMLDPSTLLIVLDAVVELTGGVGVDPQSGSLM